MAGATDTLKIYERLKAANIDERAAKESVEVFRDIRELELRLTVKLGALTALAVGIVATLIKLR
jgi:hypothetical protein